MRLANVFPMGLFALCMQLFTQVFILCKMCVVGFDFGRRCWATHYYYADD